MPPNHRQDIPEAETPDRTPERRIQGGWSFWALWVSAYAVVGTLSYLMGTVGPLSKFSLPPAAMIIFGLLAGGVQGFALRRQIPTARRWILASSLAGFVAACVSVVSTSLAETSTGLLAGWAYAWAAYGAVLGVMLQRISPRRWLALVSLAGWAIAGLASGAVGWALDVFSVLKSIPTIGSFLPSSSRTWSMVGLGVIGAVSGATGGAITGAALAFLPRVPTPSQDGGARNAKDAKRVRIAGIVNGLIAAALCTYLAPLVLTLLTEGSLDSMDLTMYFLNAIYTTPLCVPTIAIVSIPLSIGGGYVGLEIARASGRPNSGAWVWCGAAVGGIAGYILGSLVAFAIGDLGG